MALRVAPSRLRLSSLTFSSRQPTSTCLRCRYSTSTSADASLAAPVLARLRTDLKTAMRARDTQRLNVLRALLAEITNSGKTSSPIKDDMALLSLLKKRIGSSNTAMEDFAKADRQDLVTKEQEQVDILREYASGVQTIPADEITSTVMGVIEGIRSDGGRLVTGDVLRKMLGPGGALEGKMVEKSEVARIVKEVLAADGNS